MYVLCNNFEVNLLQANRNATHQTHLATEVVKGEFIWQNRQSSVGNFVAFLFFYITKEKVVVILHAFHLSCESKAFV